MSINNKTKIKERKGLINTSKIKPLSKKQMMIIGLFSYIVGILAGLILILIVR